jgi:peptidoglycan/LPS O-acetylase OafA/YrhL
MEGSITSLQSVKYYPAFDYLRIVLALMVAAAHSGLIAWEQAGNYSVQVFFALSGWLIGGILLRSTPADLPRFYFNRSARIWIPYFVAVALLMAASLLKERITEKWVEIFFYDFTFVYNFFGPPQLADFRDAMPLQATGNHFWSICAEEQFYLLAPFLIILLPLNIGRTIWFWMILSAAALFSQYWGYFGSISLGVLASVLRCHLGDWHSTRAARLTLGIVFTASFAATCLGLIAYRFGAPLSSICIVLFLAQAGSYSNVAAFVGGISYPMYLNHWIGGFIANAIFGVFAMRDTWHCKVSGILIGLLVATALFWIIDRNVRKNRERYFTALRGKVAAAIGFGLVGTGVLGSMALAVN